LTDLLASLYS